MSRFLVGLLLIPAFVFNTSLPVRILQTVLVIGYSLIRKKKFRLGPNLILLAGVTAMNLLSPVGEVLFRIAAFPITRIALEQGLMRALLFIGLVYISRSSISASIPLPGKGGALVARTLYYFERIINFAPPSEEKGVVYTLTHLPGRLDEILFFCSEEGSGQGAGEKHERGRAAASDGFYGSAERFYAIFLLAVFWLGGAYSLFFA